MLNHAECEYTRMAHYYDLDTVLEQYAWFCMDPLVLHGPSEDDDSDTERNGLRTPPSTPVVEVVELASKSSLVRDPRAPSTSSSKSAPTSPRQPKSPTTESP
ncbi:unnamed protein product, partial [Nesidiocoris tenuis]